MRTSIPSATQVSKTSDLKREIITRAKPNAVLFIVITSLLLSGIQGLAGIVTWTGQGKDNSWHNPTNWNGRVVPSVTDDVVISGANVSAIFAVSVNSLDMYGTRLAVTNVPFTVNGHASINTSDLTVAGGAIMSLPNLVSYANEIVFRDVNWLVVGTNSRLDMLSLTNIDGFLSLIITVKDGGRVKLGANATTKGTGMGRISFLADGPGSSIEFPGITNYSANASSYGGASITVTNGARVSFPNLVSYANAIEFRNFDWSASGTGSVIDMPSLANIDGFLSHSVTAKDGGKVHLGTNATTKGTGMGRISFLADGSGSSIEFPGITNYSANASLYGGATISVTNGALVTFPNLVSYANAPEFRDFNWSASGAGSLLDMPSLIIIDSSISTDLIKAEAGAKINLANLVNVLGRWNFIATGIGSILDLREFMGPYNNLTEEGGGKIILSQLAAPSISQPPIDQNVFRGSTALFEVVAEGPLLRYQWQFCATNLANSVQITGVNSNILTIVNTDIGDSGAYKVIVSNSGGSVTSQVAFLTINTNTAGPSIVSLPAAKTLLAGGSPVLTVVAAGTPPLTYQWASNGVAIAGATSASLFLTNTTQSSSASYAVTVANAFGTTNSNPIILTFVAPPTGYPTAVLNDHPLAYWRQDESGGSVLVDSAGFFDGTYSGAFSLGEPGVFASETAANYTGGKAEVPWSAHLNTSGAFSMELWAKSSANPSYCTLFSAQDRNAGRSGFALYHHLNEPAFEVHMGNASDVTVFLYGAKPVEPDIWYHVVLTYDGNTAKLYVDGQIGPNGSGFGAYNPNSNKPLTFGQRTDGDWPYNGLIDEVAFYNYALSAQQVSNHNSHIWSAAVITLQPVDQTRNEGETLSLTVAASGTAPLAYCWQKDGVNLVNGGRIKGVETDHLFIANLVVTDSGLYRVMVSNAAGQTNSRAASVMVNGPVVIRPQIAQHPQSRTNVVGSTASFTVTATGTTPFSYQWRKNGTPLAIGTNDTLILDNVQLADAGDYTVVVSNSAGYDTSTAARLTVFEIAPVLAHPADLNTDFRLVISEVTGYGAAWKRSQNWTNPPNPIPIGYVTRAGYLWKNGERYLYDTNGGAAPMCWVIVPPGPPAGLAAASLRAIAASTAVCAISGTNVTLSITPASTVAAYAVQDELPVDFTAANISGGGTFDTSMRQVKWGPFFDSQARVFTYALVPPAGFSGTATLVGLASFDGADMAIAGDRQYMQSGTPTVSQVARTISTNGDTADVTLAATPASTVAAYAVEDTVPANFAVDNINESGAFDSGSRKVKWGPFFDATARSFSYRIVAPPGFSGTATIAGVGSFDGIDIPIIGQSEFEITAGPEQPEYQAAMYGGLILEGTPGAHYRIDYASSLNEPIQWTPLQTITLTNSPQWWADLESWGQPKRFYRVVIAP